MTPESRRPTTTIVIDSNVFISAVLSTRGAPFQIMQRFRAGHFLLCISTGQLDELHDVLTRSRTSGKLNIPPAYITDLFTLLIEFADRVDPVETLPVSVRDTKDEIILGTALAVDADFLVTGDSDLLVLAGDPRLGRLRIVKPHEFLDVIQQE